MAEGTKRRTVLIVEDNNDIRFILEALLKNGDTRVAVAPDVTSALGVIGTLTQIDVVLTDHAMARPDDFDPDDPRPVTGLDLCRIVGARFPVVVLSAYLTPQLVDAYRAAGAVAFLDKPINASELRRIIRHHAGLDR